MIHDYRIYRNIDGKSSGSAYIEILPGPFKDKCWNPE